MCVLFVLPVINVHFAAFYFLSKQIRTQFVIRIFFTEVHNYECFLIHRVGTGTDESDYEVVQMPCGCILADLCYITVNCLNLA